MATLNLKKIGSLVKVEYTGDADLYIGSGSVVRFKQPFDGGGRVHIQLGSHEYSLDDITDLQVNGSSVTDQTDFETKIATVFPNPGGSGSQTLQETLDEGAVLDKDNTIDAGENIFTINGSRIVIGEIEDGDTEASMQAWPVQGSVSFDAKNAISGDAPYVVFNDVSAQTILSDVQEDVIALGDISNNVSGFALIIKPEAETASIKKDGVIREIARINVGDNYADDSAAATGGIPVGGLYHTSGAVKIRLA